MSLRRMFKNLSDSDSSQDTEDELIESNVDLSTMNNFVAEKSGITIHLSQEKVKGIAHQLWPAALILCNYIEKYNDTLFPNGIQRESFVELGAGIGLCGLFMAALGSPRVILTDIQDAIENLNANIHTNPSLMNQVHADLLDWSSAEDFDRVIGNFPIPPVVIASDVVYWENLYVPLFRTLQRFVNHGSIIYISHVKRWKKDTKFFAMCSKSMNVEAIMEEVTHDITRVPPRNINRIYKFSKLTSPSR